MSNKHLTNKNVPRNKRPLSNIVFRVDVIQLRDGEDPEDYAESRLKDEGYLVSKYRYHNGEAWQQAWFTTPNQVKETIGEKQWSKFCQGKREFVIQRRVNGKNVSNAKKVK